MTESVECCGILAENGRQVQLARLPPPVLVRGGAEARVAVAAPWQAVPRLILLCLIQTMSNLLHR